MLNALTFLDQIKRQTTRQPQAQNPLLQIQNMNTSGFGAYFGGQPTGQQGSVFTPQQPVNNGQPQTGSPTQSIGNPLQPPFNGQLVNPDQKVNPKGGYNPLPPPQTGHWLDNVAGGPNNPIYTGGPAGGAWAPVGGLGG